MFDTIGDAHGTDISFTPTSGNVVLAGGKAYLAMFEGAIDLIGDTGGSAIGLFLNGASIGGSGVAMEFNRVPGQVGAKSVTSPAIFKTPAGAASILNARFGDTDNTQLVGPILNVLTLGNV